MPARLASIHFPSSFHPRINASCAISIDPEAFDDSPSAMTRRVSRSVSLAITRLMRSARDPIVPWDQVGERHPPLGILNSFAWLDQAEEDPSTRLLVLVRQARVDGIGPMLQRLPRSPPSHRSRPG